MQSRFARRPNTGMTKCLIPLNMWCSRKATIATMQVVM